MQSREEDYKKYREESRALKKSGDDKTGLKLYREAIQDLEKAMITRQQIENNLLTGADHMFLGDCFLNAGACLNYLVNEKDNEIKCYLASITEYLKVNENERDADYYLGLIQFNYDNLIRTYLEVKQPENALQHCQQITKLIKDTNNMPSNESIMTNLINLYQEIVKHYCKEKQFKLAEACLINAGKLLTQVTDPSVKIVRLQSSLQAQLACDVYDLTNEHDKEIKAYHAAIAALDKVRNHENRDFREYARFYFNLTETYAQVHRMPAEIEALKLAIASLEKIASRSRTPKDKRELMLFNLAMSKLVGDTAEAVLACSKALQDQPAVDYRNGEYFENVAAWKHRVGHRYVPVTKAEATTDKVELPAIHHQLEVMQEQNRMMLNQLQELNENMKKRKAGALTGNVNSMFFAASDSDSESDSEMSEPESKRQTTPLKLGSNG